MWPANEDDTNLYHLHLLATYKLVAVKYYKFVCLPHTKSYMAVKILQICMFSTMIINAAISGSGKISYALVAKISKSKIISPLAPQV